MNNREIKHFSEYEKKYFFKELEDEIIRSTTQQQLKCAVRNAAMFRLMHYCALRATETSQLRTEYYNPLQNEIYCPRLKGGINNTLRIVDKDVLKSLKRHIRVNTPKEYLFESTKSDNHISRKTMHVIFKSYCKKMSKYQPDSSKWHCHTLRHTRAIDLADMGLDIKDVQYWLGHAEVSNTLIYFRYTSKQQAALYKKLERRIYD